MQISINLYFELSEGSVFSPDQLALHPLADLANEDENAVNSSQEPSSTQEAVFINRFPSY
jgi:hypothetical protein